MLLSAAYVAIRRKQVPVHRALMLSACGTSALFLVSYLTYHASAGTRHFPGEGWIRPVYFAILFSHTVLAAVVVPLVLVTLSRGLRNDVSRHVPLARWTLPLWLYVSVTGVVIYVMLYRLSW